LAIDDCWLGTVGNSINIRHLSQHSAISVNIQQSQNRQSPIRNLQSQSTFGNLNQHSAISKSAIANPQSAIDR